MLIPIENVHREFLGDMIDWLMKHKNEILNISFGVDIQPFIVVDMNDGSNHCFQLKSELYVRLPNLWGNTAIEYPARGQNWMDSIFTRIACPNIKMTAHPFSWDCKMMDIPRFDIYKPDLFSDLKDLILTTSNVSVLDQILNAVFANRVSTYMNNIFNNVDTRYRNVHIHNEDDRAIEVVYVDRKPPILVTKKTYSLDGSLIPVDTGGERLRKLIDDCIDKTENVETRMFLIRWKKEHYGFDEEKEMRL